MRRRQQGVALITAVLIVALVTAAAVAMASKQQFDIRRTANIFNNDAAYQFALGAEDYARNVLEWDITKGNPDVDHLGEDWAQVVSVPVEGAMLTGSLQDLQGRFNLNTLVDPDGQKPNHPMVERFKNLLRSLDLDEGIADAVVDWIDEDNTNPTGFGGAEDDYYMLQNPPYRAANGMMVSTSELLLIKGVDYEKYQALAPYVTALPSHETKINVNTAPPLVLSAIEIKLTPQDGEALVQTRTDKDDAFGSIDDFLGQSEITNLNLQPDEIEKLKTKVLDVKSEYFLLTAMAEFDQSTAHLSSLLKRDPNGAVHVLMRSRGAF